MIQALRDSYQKHQRWTPILFFVLGFIFDAFMLKRADELLAILQQALYIVISATFIGIELVETTREVHAPRWVVKIWKYREAVLHFLMGTLLNAYTIFYFKSASALSSFVFIAILVAVLIMNEFQRFGKSQTQVHVTFLSLCLISYLITLAPIVLGFIGIIPFLVANLVAVLVALLYYRLMETKFLVLPRVLRTHVLMPFVAIQAFFAILYFTHLIPPVPLSVSFIGIYHDVKKSEGEYELSYSRSATKFWQNGDQTFLARPGDTIFCFARIFSPSRFKDQLQVRWLYWDAKRGWETSDVIPLPVVGGREEGYRAITKKTNYSPGEWRIQIETTDSREIGRIRFSVEADGDSSERVMTTVVE